MIVVFFILVYLSMTILVGLLAALWGRHQFGHLEEGDYVFASVVGVLWPVMLPVEILLFVVWVIGLIIKALINDR